MKYVLLFFSMVATASGWTQSLSPQVIASSGGYKENGNNSLSWTLGESMIQTLSSPGTILTQGFQQSNYTITSIVDIAKPFLIKIYPNPASDYFYVNLETAYKSKLTLKIIDVYGRIHQVEAIETSRQIDISNFIPGLYYIQIFDDKNLPIQSYELQIIN